jgi:prepilin-type N-terminal cleavage/methylation domain-containing protein
MNSSKRGAFTLTEIVVVVGILGILITLLVPAAQRVIPQAQKVVCMSHLRTLWLAFSPCATDSEGWPQVPKGIKIGTTQEQQWWLDYSTNHLGLTAKDWHCPVIERASRNSSSSSGVPVIHYLPTLFDARRGTPNRWPSMPWFSELGDVHGQGNLTVRADGSIQAWGPLNP